MRNFDFNELFVLDMANNHQGDLKHGLNIVKAFGDVARTEQVRVALKFQFRQLDTLIHDDFKKREDVPHIPRFMNTALKVKDYEILTQAVRDEGMVTICTPFDEESVDLILKLGIEIIKIASCSAADFPLLERISETKRPVIVSTAGLSSSKIDSVVGYLEERSVDFALMHCVALYPTPHEKLNLNQIDWLKARYPEVPVGFSTHEDPGNLAAVQMACAKGARIYERHVGLATDKYKLNAYSSTPEQITAWIRAYKDAMNCCGGEERAPSDPKEMESLRSLMRGVYAAKNISAKEEMGKEDVFFAMPLQKDQLTSGEWGTGYVADRDYLENEPLLRSVKDMSRSPDDHVQSIMLQVKALLSNARVFVGRDSSVEISHHYGLDRFREFGCVIVDCVNRDYCKKIIVQLPRQKHPYHYHEKKEETFQLLYGDMEIELNGKRTSLEPGDKILVPAGAWHKFHTLDGAVLEEISTTHYNADSIYEDEKIAMLAREQRKTQIPHWRVAPRIRG